MNTMNVPEGVHSPDQSILLTVTPFVLGNEFCERLAFYGLSTNLIMYLTERGQSPGSAAVSINLFEGTCYLTPLLGAWLADAYWGRYKTILVFSWIYFWGMFLLVASAAAPTKSLFALYAALYTIALGTGGIKANNSAFGADQFDDNNPRDCVEKRSFFNWFYFSINVGSLIAATAVVYVQENISWTIGFAIPTVAMLVAIVVFVAGRPRYRHVQPTGSPLSRIVQVSVEAWNRRRDSNHLSSGTDIIEEESLVPNSMEEESLVPDARNGGDATDRGPHGWLNFARGRYSFEDIEDVKLFYGMLPMFFATILYWTVYMQMGSFFVVQGSKMDRHLGETGTLEIPAASLAVIDTVAIVSMIPMYDLLFVPVLKQLGRPMTTLQRIGWGLVICSLSMFAAAIVEGKRLEVLANGKILSIWYQVPQYILVGASEVFASVGTMEFFYDKAPRSMRSCASALQLLSVCIGSYLSSFLVIAVQWLSTIGGGDGWLPVDLDEGRLDCFFMLLSFAMTVNVVVFIWICNRFY
jgi:peptide/histidine transporter 3/4